MKYFNHCAGLKINLKTPAASNTRIAVSNLSICGGTPASNANAKSNRNKTEPNKTEINALSIEDDLKNAVNDSPKI
ncbi:MAG TPA: hypothetical protein PKI54_02600, partial [Bacteroidia bacterium]|nr:hypothetical protein [Bacteroidia bacterium]HNL03705.1 hypothetical protein [Bacteroidia bacterium]HNL33429.1 hypothetical protein [Bacteroidia bacterium]